MTRPLKAAIKAFALSLALDAMIFAAAVSPMLVAPAHADPAGCIIQPWGFLGSQQRGICDGPVQRDGSWQRHRIVAVPAHQASTYTSCSGGGGYTLFCTGWGGGFVPYTELDNERYRVTPDTVLPDEPGHLD